MPSSSLPLSRRRLLSAAGAATASGLLRFAPEAAATDGPGSYYASWPSVDQHPPAPVWFQDAKFGIHYHWGVFSVPAFGNEWYPRTMYIGGSAENRHHIATYGDPSVWPYNNFIDGARDKAGTYVQFAPKPASQGGNWDPDAWAQLFKAAGAKFAGPVAEHHDGFSMWNSRSNPWNSVQHGPGLDLVGLQAQSIRPSNEPRRATSPPPRRLRAQALVMRCDVTATHSTPTRATDAPCPSPDHGRRHVCNANRS